MISVADAFCGWRTGPQGNANLQVFLFMILKFELIQDNSYFESANMWAFIFTLLKFESIQDNL